MNLKYYLRGLGLGIVITAIVMGIASSGKKEVLTDAEVRTKAKELGMIEEAVLTEYVEKARTETEKKVRRELEAEALKAAEEKLAAENAAISESAGISDTEEEEQAEPVIFAVKKGETPISISERLESSGLVSAATDFDKYLVDNGYDRKIVASEYMIPIDADMELIAKIITGHKITEETE